MGFLGACVEIWTGFHVYNAVFSDGRKHNKFENMIYVTASLILGTLLWMSRKEYFVSLDILMIYICVTSIVVWIVKREKPFLILCTMWTCYVLITSVQIVLSIGFFMPGNIFTGSYEVLIGLAPFTAVIYLSGSVLMITMISLIENYLADIKTAIEKNFCFLLCVDMIFYLILCFWNNLIVENAGIELQILGIFPIFAIMIGIMIVLLFADVVSKYKVVEKENETLLVREEIARKQYEEQVKLISQNRQIVHDIKNHLLVLKEFARLKETDSIQKYIDEISDDYVVALSKYWTGHHVIDFILNQKMIQAEKNGTRFTVNTLTIREIPLSESEICALFGNILDNAIEATSKIPEGKGWIEVQISQKKKMFFVEIANNYVTTPIYRNGEFISVKHTDSAHGYGLKSVQRIVDKYDGMLTYQMKNHIFKLDISFLDF